MTSVDQLKRKELATKPTHDSCKE